MLARERQRIICEKVFQNGQVLVSELAKELSVSDETIRRDINVLDKAKRLRRVHGGAIPLKEASIELPYRKRLETNMQAKRKIAACAAGLLADNDIAAFGYGVTADEMIRQIHGVRNVTLLIASVTALNLLVEKKLSGDFTGEIIFLGGVVNVRDNCVSGSMTNLFLENLSVNKAFIGATGIDSNGVHAYTLDDGIFSAQLIRHTDEVYVLAESAKFEKHSLYKACDLDAIHHLITDLDSPLSPAMQQTLKENGVQVHYV